MIVNYTLACLPSRSAHAVKLTSLVFTGSFLIINIVVLAARQYAFHVFALVCAAALFYLAVAGAFVPALSSAHAVYLGMMSTAVEAVVVSCSTPLRGCCVAARVVCRRCCSPHS
jgi:hypothetical protein